MDEMSHGMKSKYRGEQDEPEQEGDGEEVAMGKRWKKRKWKKMMSKKTEESRRKIK